MEDCQFILEAKTSLYTPINLKYQANTEFNIQGFIQRLDNYLNKFENNITEIKREREQKTAELTTARQNQCKPFPQAALLNALRQDNREVMRELNLMQKDPSYKSTWKPQSLDAHDKSHSKNARSEAGWLATQNSGPHHPENGVASLP